MSTARRSGGLGFLAFAGIFVAAMYAPAPYYPLWLVRLITRELALIAPLLIAVGVWIDRRHPARARRWLVRAGAIGLTLASILPVAATLPLFRRHGLTFSLWQYVTGAPSVGSRVTVEHDIVLAPDRPDLRVDVYRPTSASPTQPRLPGPAIVVIHGGSYQRGDKGDVAGVSRHLAAAGYAVVDLRYRLSPRDHFPAAVQDILCVLGHLASSGKNSAGERFAIDPKRIALLGRSAGGNLALTAGYVATATGPDLPAIAPGCAVAAWAPRAVVSIYPWGDLRALHDHPPKPDPLGTPAIMEAYIGGTPQQLPAAYDHASPQLYIRRRPPGSLPSTLLLHGSGDLLVHADNSRALASALRTAGYAPMHVEIPFADHGFDFRPGGAGEQLERALVVKFLDRALAP